LVFDEHDISTGEIRSYPGFKADEQFTLGTEEPVFNHCFVVNEDPAGVPIDTRRLPLKRLGTFYHADSGILLKVLSTEPAFQLYTGEYNDVPAVENLPARGPRSGFCVEPSRYVNAVNGDAWKAMVTLKRGERYGSKIVYRAWSNQEPRSSDSFTQDATI
jgi:aldose 1-epimerase